MGRMTFGYREVISSVKTKTPVPAGHWRSGKERTAPIIIEDIEISRVTIPKGKGGGRDLKPGTLNSIRKQLLLTKPQFTDFVICRMSGSDYINEIKDKYPDIYS